MEDRPEPYSWQGRQVVASIVEAGGYNQNHVPYPLEAPEQTGTLEKVSELGILASLVADPEDEAVSTFYPWSAVLYLRLQD